MEFFKGDIIVFEKEPDYCVIGRVLFDEEMNDTLFEEENSDIVYIENAIYYHEGIWKKVDIDKKKLQYHSKALAARKATVEDFDIYCETNGL